MAFSNEIRVYYEDTDAGGVVYHANYLRFIERCRSDWLVHSGWPVDRVARDLNTAFIVTAVNAKFVAPARLMDELRVTVDVARLRRVRFDAHQRVWRGDELLFDAEVSLACVDALTFKPCAIPAPLHAILQSSLTPP
jgi:acyl-CoA thioester hydrolase